jgi:hypothetical protein
MRQNRTLGTLQQADLQLGSLGHERALARVGDPARSSATRRRRATAVFCHQWAASAASLIQEDGDGFAPGQRIPSRHDGGGDGLRHDVWRDLRGLY